MNTGYLTRLRKEQKALEDLSNNSDTWNIVATSWEKEGANPPAIQYRIRLAARSIIGIDKQDEPIYAFAHQFRLEIPSTFIEPRDVDPASGDEQGAGPYIYAETALWHPQVWPNQLVCTGKFWLSNLIADSQLRLLLLIVTYKDYNDDKLSKRGVAGEMAAEWCQQYRARHPKAFPLDQTDVPPIADLEDEFEQRLNQSGKRKRLVIGPRPDPN